MAQAHYEARPQLDVGDPLFFKCERCGQPTYQTVIGIEPIKCEAHGLTIGFSNILRCNTCGFTNYKKRIEIYPC